MLRGLIYSHDVFCFYDDSMHPDLKDNQDKQLTYHAAEFSDLRSEGLTVVLAINQITGSYTRALVVICYGFYSYDGRACWRLHKISG